MDLEGSKERLGDAAAERVLEGAHVDCGNVGKQSKTFLVGGPDGGISAVNVEEQPSMSLRPAVVTPLDGPPCRCSCIPSCFREPRHPKNPMPKHKVNNRHKGI
jgi:hypothetical protein